MIPCSRTKRRAEPLDYRSFTGWTAMISNSGRNFLTVACISAALVGVSHADPPADGSFWRPTGPRVARHEPATAGPRLEPLPITSAPTGPAIVERPAPIEPPATTRS